MIVALADDDTPIVLTLKFAVLLPAATVTVVGTVALDELELMLTVIPVP